MRRRQQLEFHEWYLIACEYYNAHGNLLVPRFYRTKDGYGFGRWIERMRASYNNVPSAKGRLSKEQIKMLNKIGMVWKLENRFAWEDWLKQCRLYIAEYGNLLVPVNYKNGDYALGNWIREQRKNKKNNLLTEYQVASLEEVGMVWEVTDADLWNRTFKYLKAYIQKTGTIDVPMNVKTPDGIELRNWFVQNKSKYREENCKSKTEWKHHNQLQKLIDKYDTKIEYNANSYYYLAQQYYQIHGNLDVPTEYDTGTNKNLATWVRKMWSTYHRVTPKSSVTYLKKRKELEALGFSWKLENHWEWDPKETLWLQYYNQVCEFYKEHKVLPTVANDFRLSSGISAGAWLANQKKVLAQNNLPSEKATLITALLGKSEDNPDSWDYKYNEIKAYVDKNGELPVGANAIILSSGTNSDTWVRNQRQNLSNGIMLERKSMLNAIGITASAKKVFAKDVWQPNYNEVLAFYKENGRLPGRKIDFKLSSGSLGSSWVKNEQQAIKNNERNSDQLKLLSKIGITNRPGKKSYAYWLINYNAAKQHYIDGGNNLDHNDNFILPTGTKLRNWLDYMHFCLKNGKMSNEQIELLRQIGITK